MFPGSSPGVPHQQRRHPVQRLGHCWPGEVRRTERWILHPGPVRHHHVRRHLQGHLQERPQLAQGLGQSLREHPHRSHREQGRHQGQKSQGWLKIYSFTFKGFHGQFSSRPSPSCFTERRTFSIMTSQPSQITTLRSHSCGWPGS